MNNKDHPANFSEYPIGYIFQYEDKFYKVLEDEATDEICTNCAFIGCICSQFCCTSYERPDKKTVVFIECDKAGNEITII